MKDLTTKSTDFIHGVVQALYCDWVTNVNGDKLDFHFSVTEDAIVSEIDWETGVGDDTHSHSHKMFMHYRSYDLAKLVKELQLHFEECDKIQNLIENDNFYEEPDYDLERKA